MQLSKLQLWLITAGCFLVIAVWDYNVRISLKQSSFENRGNTEVSYSFKTNELSEETVSSIRALYAKFDVPKPIEKQTNNNNKKVNKGLSVEQQNAQQGELNKFYIGEHTYILQGIFNENKPFAVIIQRNINTNKLREIKVELNQLLPPYKVTKITNKSIEFTLESKVIRLTLF